MPSHERTLRLLKSIARIEPARPSLKTGLRAAVAALVPVLVGLVAPVPATSWATLGGFLATVADKGGSYRARAATMGALTVAGALAAVAMALAGGSPWIATIALFLGISAAGFARVYGAEAGSVGGLVAIIMAASVAAPAGGAEALARGAGVLAGGLWAMALALLLWPIRPYRPVRVAVAACYRALADQAAALEEASRRGEEAGYHALVQRHASIRAAIEAARAALGGVRRGRQGESGRGERLLVLLQDADQLFGTLVVLADTLEAAGDPGPSDRRSDARVEAERALAAFAGKAHEVARVVETEGGGLRLQPIAWDEQALRAAIARDAPEGGRAAAMTRSRLLHAAALLAQLRECMRIAAETASTLDDDSPEEDTPGEPAASAPPGPELRDSVLGPLRENLTARSLSLRHALRVGLAAAAGMAVSQGFELRRGYWITITAVSVLQPYTGATVLKGLQRIAGTVLGCLLAAGIAAVVHDPLGLLALIFVLATAGVALLPVNYGVFSALLTPTFVLLAELGSGDYHLTQLRVVNTLIGGAIALAAIALLWPSPERDRFPEQMAQALRAAREVLAQAAASYGSEQGGAEAPLAAARRDAGLATSNAEASFQRLVSESRGAAEALEPLMAELTYTRRFVASVVALASSPGPRASPSRREELARFERRMGRALEDLAAAVAEQRPPAPLPDVLAPEPADDGSGVEPAPTTLGTLFEAQLVRIARQVTVLHAAVSRAALAARERSGP
ncbi:FUSC family protein [Sorangium sp. So ce136]|uniref:FUSC family protein n=1 Tax=Sorangium sp. So ce136 TaxID=3133284 RepID=UPI003F07C42D